MATALLNTLCRAVFASSPKQIRSQADQRLLDEYNAAGVMATPANSNYNEKVIEGARKIDRGQRPNDPHRAIVTFPQKSAH